MKLFDSTPCTLGEGPIWHPLRASLFWFDILSGRLYQHNNGITSQHQFDGCVSAAGWIDKYHLLIASESGLWKFHIDTGATSLLQPLEADNPATRSNDGRADPWGGFWIGTMGKKAETGVGAIYRYYCGTITRLLDGVSIPNAICFSPDRQWVYYTDTPTRIVYRQALDSEGWLQGNTQVFLDLNQQQLNPDGAVVDQEGNFWNAQWGASRVACYNQDGLCITSIDCSASHISCPAFGGRDGRTIFVTSAREGLHADELQQQPLAGSVFSQDTMVQGQQEYQVIVEQDL